MKEAFARLEAAVLARPWDGEAWGQLGLVYRCAGHHEMALPVLRRAAELGTSEPYHWFHLSNALDQADEPDEALEAARKAVAIAPGSKRMLVTLGARLLTCRKPHEAIPYLEKAARGLPDWAEARGMLGIGGHPRVRAGDHARLCPVDPVVGHGPVGRRGRGSRLPRARVPRAAPAGPKPGDEAASPAEELEGQNMTLDNVTVTVALCRRWQTKPVTASRTWPCSAA